LYRKGELILRNTEEKNVVTNYGNIFSIVNASKQMPVQQIIWPARDNNLSWNCKANKLNAILLLKRQWHKFKKKVFPTQN